MKRAQKDEIKRLAEERERIRKKRLEERLYRGEDGIVIEFVGDEFKNDGISSIDVEMYKEEMKKS